MAIWLVTASPLEERLDELGGRVTSGEIEEMRPFGPALDRALRGARRGQDGMAVWVEEDYCRPPLAAERDAVLDDHFREIEVEDVGDEEAGWRRIRSLPRLFPELEGDPAGGAGSSPAGSRAADRLK